MAESPVRAWVQGPGVGRKAFWCASARCCVLDLLRRHCREQDVPVECFFVRCNGVLVGNGDAVQHGAVYTLEPRLRGGKGGFGSMLRALGAQIEKTTNREACRDLSGRRLRDVNHEKAMAEWVKQQAEREAEKEQRRLERLQRKLAEPKHCFASPDYQQQCHEMAERLEDSVLKGMQAASSKLVSAEIGEPRIRPRRSNADHGAPARKRKCLWLGMESLETAEVSSDEDSNAAPTASGLSCSSAPASGSGSAETAAELPCGSQSVGMPSAGSVAPANPPSQMADPAEDMSGDSCTGEAPSAEGRVEELGREAEATPGRKETEPAGDTAVTRLAKGHEAEEVTDGGRPAVVEPEEDIPKLEEGQSGHTVPGQEVLDLLAFGSASELELLGLERLKKELTALGLKCGGTLQERAARLFAVRGLAREQIDPALFARPSRGKKK